VFSYGYNSNTVFTSAVTDIDDEAAALLDSLVGERQSSFEKCRPIIFVSHSLGGIVVKKVSYLRVC
jgi:surfactin synthase thioesterase subunit